jgi:hypothetical protein
MKKMILIIFISIAVSATAQLSPKLPSSSMLFPDEQAGVEKPSGNTKSLGVTLWSDNFDNPANWTIDNYSQLGPIYGWNIDSTIESWWFAGYQFNSTSGGNFAEVGNGNPNDGNGSQALGVVYTLTTANPIDVSALGGSNNVSLSFEQFGARYSDLQEIQISLDGINFISVGNNLDKVLLSFYGGANYPNPSLKTINLGPFLPVNPGNVWIRFRWTTNWGQNFGATNPDNWITYGWFIDDVKLSTNPTNDLSLIDRYWSTAGEKYYGYGKIPLTQATPIDFEIRAFNGGINTQTGVKYNVNVNSGYFIGSSAPATIQSLDSATLTVSPSFTPTALGNYSIVQSISSDSIDDIPFNNVISTTNFQLTDYVYARDRGTVNGATEIGFSSFNGDLEIGNTYHIWANQICKGIDVRMISGTPYGTNIFVKIYSIDTSSNLPILIASSYPVTVGPGYLNTVKTIPLSEPVNLLANNLYAATIGTNDSLLRVSNSGAVQSEFSSVTKDNDSTWSPTDYTPWVRLNFDPSIVGIKEQLASLVTAIYPNPTKDILTVEMNLSKSTNGTIKIYNSLGILCLNKSFESTIGLSKQELNLVDLSSGVYTITTQTSEGLAIQKFIKL